MKTLRIIEYLFQGGTLEKSNVMKQNNENLVCITTSIPEGMKQKAVDLNIRYSEATTLGLEILIKQKESLRDLIERGV